MPLPPPQTQEFVDRLASLAVECREELARSSQSIQEIDLLIRQTQQEIDRLSQRETQMNARVRDLEASLESYSRSEIRDTYVQAHETQMRLFMMRSQIEQLESRRDSIDQQQEKLRILLDLAEINREQSQVEMQAEDRTRILPGTQIFGNDVDVSAEIVDAREQERVRIAQQLTDGPAQVLANVVLRAQILERVAERAPDQLPEEIQDLSKLVTDSLVDVRRAIFETRPLVLDEIGLVQTLRRYTADFAREHGATITVDGPEYEEEGLQRHARTVLFRLLQQAIVALVQPGVGTQVQVTIQDEGAQMVARIDATSVGAGVSNRIGRFVEDDYINDNLELIGATMQRESISGGERLTIILPLQG